jgi:hypothetical protein
MYARGQPFYTRKDHVKIKRSNNKKKGDYQPNMVHVLIRLTSVSMHLKLTEVPKDEMTSPLSYYIASVLCKQLTES